MRRRHALWLTAVLFGCGSSASDPDDAVAAGGEQSCTSETCSDTAGGAAESGPTGGLGGGGGAARGATSAAAGAADGAAGAGGLADGGANAGGTATGGASVGGFAAGGNTVTGSGGANATGGRGVAGSSGANITGGSSAGGTMTRGSAAGGGSSGGNAIGGASAGGGSSGGTATGGAAFGGSTGECQESSCGSHKWACWRMPNPASSASSVPNHQSYTDLGNGAVRDNITCLVWEKANPENVGDWQANVDRCADLASSGYAGFDDWRLPTRVEMASIVDVTRGRTGYPEVFGVTSGYYATGSWWMETITGQDNAGRHWGYGTNGFTSNSVLMSDTLVARCVRGNGSGEAANELAVEPPEHYTVTGIAPDAEVLDNYTGLVWQQGFSPSLMAWSEAPAYCSSLNLNGHTGWRVPTLNELASTVNEAKVGGAINASAFPNNPNGCKEPKYWFWAAEASKVGGEAWGLSYCDGFTGNNSGSSGDWNYFPTANVRCVR
ncbi:MAG: DUF1566 domain-containing protein [Polyangiaceae bacterium]|nr:DUF1566 domain-containing protein [Polyangiaceae bacterium]